MEYVYSITYKNGIKEWSYQKHQFTEQEVLDAFKPHGVVKVEFHTQIPRGYHMCACGNLVHTTNQDELCDECKEIYGHSFEYEL